VILFEGIVFQILLLKLLSLYFVQFFLLLLDNVVFLALELFLKVVVMVRLHVHHMIVLDVPLQAALGQENVITELAGVTLALLVLLHVSINAIHILDLLPAHGTL